MEQRSPEWFEARKGRVTGSVVGAILGLSPYMTREDVLRSMVRAYHGAPIEFTGNPATEWGTAMEPQARADYEMDTCQDATDAPFVPFEDWLGASPDAYVGADGLAEFKCPFSNRNDNPPVFKLLVEQPHYYAQCQIELYVTGRKWLHFYQWTPFGQSLSPVVTPDRDWLDTNLPRLRQFHAEFLDALETPEDHLAPLRITIDTPQAHAMLREYDELAEAIVNAEERKKEVLAEIVALAGEKNALVAGRKVTRVSRAGAVKYAAVVKEHLPKLDLEPYRGKASSFWQVS